MYQKGLLIALEEVRAEYLQESCQGFSALTWGHGTTLKNPKDQDGHKKGTLSDQQRLTHVTPTPLLGSWVLQPIKDMTSLGTDFEMHANWQGYIEVPAAKNFLARNVCTITLSKVQGTHWNMIKCKEHLGDCPKAVVRQTTINLNSRVLKSLEDS